MKTPALLRRHAGAGLAVLLWALLTLLFGYRHDAALRAAGSAEATVAWRPRPCLGVHLGSKTVEFGVASAAALAAVYALFLQVRIRRADAASALIARWNAVEFRPLHDEFRRIVQEPGYLVEEEPAPDGNFQHRMRYPRQKATIVPLLNAFEEMALAVERRTADESILFEFYGEIVVAVDRRLKIWIGNERQRTDSSGNKTQTTAFEHFTRLAERWRKRLSRSRN